MTSPQNEGAGPGTSAKLNSLKNMLSKMGSVLLAYSGGLDSTFLLKVASEVLKDKVVAVTAVSATFPGRELEAAGKNARLMGVKHLTVKTGELDNDNFLSNSPRRCYYCKKELFSGLRELAGIHHLNCVIDGSNYDDRLDYRPGRKAAAELGVKSPLREARLTKEEIRVLSKEMNLPTWNKPPQACLASRLPYGTRITRERLSRIDEAEGFLLGLGITQLRVRDHGAVARIEVLKSEMPIFLSEEISNRIVDRFKALGYTYVALDLAGYRTGSLNETLPGKRVD